jgi:hypothetical protein
MIQLRQVPADWPYTQEEVDLAIACMNRIDQYDDPESLPVATSEQLAELLIPGSVEMVRSWPDFGSFRGFQRLQEELEALRLHCTVSDETPLSTFPLAVSFLLGTPTDEPDGLAARDQLELVVPLTLEEELDSAARIEAFRQEIGAPLNDTPHERIAGLEFWAL